MAMAYSRALCHTHRRERPGLAYATGIRIAHHQVCFRSVQAALHIVPE